MSERVSLSAQIDAVTSAVALLSGGAPKPRPSEREDVQRRLAAVARTLQWLAEREDALRAVIGARPE